MSVFVVSAFSRVSGVSPFVSLPLSIHLLFSASTSFTPFSGSSPFTPFFASSPFTHHPITHTQITHHPITHTQITHTTQNPVKKEPHSIPPISKRINVWITAPHPLSVASKPKTTAPHTLQSQMNPFCGMLPLLIICSRALLCQPPIRTRFA